MHIGLWSKYLVSLERLQVRGEAFRGRKWISLKPEECARKCNIDEIKSEPKIKKATKSVKR
jgi:hypothetical protein